MSLREQQIQTLESASEYIPKLINGLNSIVINIQSNKELEFLEFLPKVLEGLDWILQVISLTKDMNKEEVSIEVSEKILKDMLDSLQNQDYILFSDIIEYELIPNLKDYKNYIQKLLINRE